MTAKHYAAFDLGAESGRTLLGTLDSGKLSLKEVHRFPNPTLKTDGHLHWDLPRQWKELKTGLRKTVDTGVTLAGIGIDTWGVDFGLLDAGGQLLGNPFMYRDSRTEGMIDRAIARVGRETIFNATGIQIMSINTLYQLFSMRETRSPLLDRAATLLFMPDLFNSLFTGVRKSEFSIASTSQMLDPRTGDWATDLLKSLDLPTKLLCDIVPGGTVLGPIKDDVAAECGAAGVPVIAPCGHDTASAVASVPAQGGNWCFLSSGTWSIMGVELNKPIINEKSLRYNYTNEGGFGGSIRFMRNIIGLWLVQECRRFWKLQGKESTYAELTEMAANAKPFGPVIDPDYAPLLAPDDMPIKIAKFCEKTAQPVPQSVGEFVRTCLESLALTYRRTLEGLEDMLGRRIEVIHIVGGGTQNELLNQMTADACGRKVITGPVEATAIGNILVQAIAKGHVKSLAQARSIVRESFDVKHYEPMNAEAWDKAYGRYVSILGKGS